MWNKPTKEKLGAIPGLYGQTEKPLNDVVIHAHFFVGACDWYIAEYDGGDLFYGFAILHPGTGMAEWGYISLSELESVKVNGLFEVDFDLHWEPKRAGEIPKIVAEGGCKKPAADTPWRKLLIAQTQEAEL